MPKTLIVDASAGFSGAPWVASAATGLSRFSYGDAATPDDDVWRHSQPVADVPDQYADDLAQTVLDLEPIAGGVWAATVRPVWTAAATARAAARQQRIVWDANIG